MAVMDAGVLVYDAGGSHHGHDDDGGGVAGQVL